VKRLLSAVAVVAAVLGLSTGIALADRTYQDGTSNQANGGGLLAENGQLDWQIPGDAYANNMKLRYTPKTIADFPAPPEGTIVAGPPFTLQMWDIDSGELVTTYKPTTLTVHYNPADLGGRSESTLRLAVRNGVDGTLWNDIPSTVDTVNHIVVAHMSDSGDYALLASNAPATPVPAEPAAPAPVAPVPAPAANPAPIASVPMNSGITGKVFYDKNGNGVMDGDDFPIAGAGLKISSGTWSAVTTTDTNGAYAFWDLRESAYNVELVVGPEWAFTTPNVASGIKVTGQLDSRGTADFGMWYKLP
jgi:hypothetical protein